MLQSANTAIQSIPLASRSGATDHCSSKFIKKSIDEEEEVTAFCAVLLLKKSEKNQVQE